MCAEKAKTRGKAALSKSARSVANAFSFIEREALWVEQSRLVVAVSGGADSLCLLGILLDMQQAKRPLAPAELIVAHLDHGLRGAAGVEDAAWVTELAASLHLRCFTEAADVRALARAKHLSIEDAARRARYAFLRRVAAQVDAACICTGHTADDQVETIVMHWLRGSGLRGLAGMAARNGAIVRPLLCLTHAEAVDYCAACGWTPRQDVSNDDLTFQRNRIRHQLLPLLEGYNPALRQTLLRNAAIIAEDEHYLDEQSNRLYDEVCLSQDETAVVISMPLLGAALVALRRRIIRRAVEHLAADTSDTSLEARHLLLIEQLLAMGQTGTTLNLPGNLRIERGYDTLILRRGASEEQADEAVEINSDMKLPVPGACDLPALGWHVICNLHDGTSQTSTAIGHQRSGVSTNAAVPEHTSFNYPAEDVVQMDADCVGDHLLVRTWQPGDRFRPLGMLHEKKLQDYFTDARVPRNLRHRIPLLFNDQHLVWVAGLRLDERVRVTPQTKRILSIQMKPIE